MLQEEECILYYRNKPRRFYKTPKIAGKERTKVLLSILLHMHFYQVKRVTSLPLPPPSNPDHSVEVTPLMLRTKPQLSLWQIIRRPENDLVAVQVSRLTLVLYCK